MESTPRTTLHRHADRGSHDRAVIRRVLDEALLCHVALVVDGEPCVLPLAFARVGDDLMLHGANRNRMLGELARGATVCITATCLDGLVFARSALRHSMNYRSVVVFGRGRTVTARDEKRAALETLIDRYGPGRSAALRPNTEAELDGTLVVAVPWTEASAKVRTGPPVDLDADCGARVWAGVVPLRQTWGTPVPVADLADPGCLPPAPSEAPGTLSFQPLGAEAFDEGVALARGAGWADVRGDWEELLASGQMFGARGPDGALWASGLVCDFGTVAAISKILVRADVRRQGLATRAMGACVATARAGQVVWLTATPEGRRVYERLGFEEVDRHEILVGVPQWGANKELAPLDASGLDAACALDARSLGCDRRKHLAPRWKRAHRASVVSGPGDEMRGFALSVAKDGVLGVGPVIARNEDDAFALIRSVTAGWDGAVRVDVPQLHEGLRARLLAGGLSREAVRPEMTLHGAPLPGERHLRYALCTAASM
jgi:nitroimidazol reductase NimA-like FMN-containing flavoprotein (pyridoxamine 5'-phosphate oxidase superfamily)/GNAT superfamily N-acetyltransferase